jgi:DNA-binding protein H-NS
VANIVKSGMSNYQELIERKRELDKAIAQARRKESDTALNTIKELIATFGFTAQQVFPYQSTEKKKVPAKYYDAATGNSWTGRGKMPLWLQGKDLSDYEVSVPKSTVYVAPTDDNNPFPIQ